ncbi:MAG TPA: STAS domain-containing protein [Gemmataceae bacterium]|jgi:anti-anti-sigma factor|nr:STAS domain-containing protein [Gemmataceae bacterium]
MSTLSVRIYEVSGAVVIRLEGEAGIKAADSLQVPLQRVTAARPALVIFDMAELGFVASLFLGLLVNFRRGLAKHGTKIQMAGVRPNIRETFQVTRLDELFEFVTRAPPAPAATN